MEGQTVYTTFDCLDEVLLFKEESQNHRLLYKVISDFSDVMINIEDDEFDRLIDNNPFVKSLVKRPDKKIYPLKPFFDNIENEDLSNFSRDIFILDKSKSFCDSTKDKSGILVLKTDSLSEMTILARRESRSYEKGQKTEYTKDETSISGWPSYVENLKIKPINSAVLIDNHLFNNFQSGKYNLVSLIGSILPKALKVKFNLLIVIDNREAKFNKEKLLNLKNEIQTELESLVDYEIDIGIVTHSIDEDFHQRVLITNYHIIKADYGFDCFDDEGKVKKSNDISTKSAYYTLKNDEGDAEIKIICRKLKSVKRLISKIQTSKSNIITNLIVGDYSNRLLSDF